MMSQGRRQHSSQLMSEILHPQTNFNVSVPTISPATGFQFRELSHRPRNTSGACSKPARKYRLTPNAKPPGRSVVSRRAPFAERTKTHNAGGPRRNPGQRDSFPRYSSINDPHLFHYYARKFGFELIPPLTQSVSRLKSARHKSSENSRSGKGPSNEAKDLYRVKVKTGDKRDAGTHAKVFLMVKGSKGKISKQRLLEVPGLDKSQTPTFHFCPGSCHTFNVYGPDVGEVKSISLEHDGLLEKQAWFVAEVSVTSMAKGKTWHFVCHKWLSLFHTDCQRERTFYPATSSDRQRLSCTNTRAAVSREFILLVLHFDFFESGHSEVE